MKKGFLSLILLISVYVVFAQGNSFYIKNIAIEGNKKTKDKIIFRELLFTTGITYNSVDFEDLRKRSEENLMNTFLFITAKIGLSNITGDTTDVKIELVERWYLWPTPQADIDERNFNVWWQKKSFDRLSAGVYLTKSNFRGKMELVNFQMMLGYNQQYGVGYQIPYINKSKTIGLGADFYWSGRHEVFNRTLKDKQVYYKDVDNYVRQEFTFGINTQVRRNFYTTHFLQISYNHNLFSQGLLDSSVNYNWKNLTNISYLSLYYKLKIDYRDFKTYPLKGYYFDIEFFKYGFGIFKNQKMNLADIKTTMRKYWKLSERFYYAMGAIGKISNYTSQVFYLQKSLGYGRDFVRGYEYYVVDGQYYGVIKSNIKYALFPERISRVNSISTTKFNIIPWAVYTNFFFDGGYVSRGISQNISNELPGKLLYSAGIGIDVTTYYDKVVRFEFALNGRGETGFFLHFIAPL